MIITDPTPTTTTIHFSITDSLAGPFGYLWLAGAADDEPPVVIGSGWTEEPAELIKLVHPSLINPSKINSSKINSSKINSGVVGADTPAGVPVRIDPAGHRQLNDAVTAYSDGDLTAIDRVAVRQRSGPFLEAAWAALRQVQPGAPRTYTELASAAGRAEAVRAAAAACAANAVALFVPCHRIVRRDGGLGGFRYGLQIKRRLLAHEA